MLKKNNYNQKYICRKLYCSTRSPLCLLAERKTAARCGSAMWSLSVESTIAYLPQDLRLFPELTAIENIQLKNRLTNFKTEKEIISYFERLGIPEKVNSPVGKLSIGQQQRVAIIRALCQPADFILLDEPVSHLDETNNAIVAQMVTEEAARQGAGVISTSVGNNVKISVDKELKL